MNFALTRSRYKGPLNYAAYFGMLGDIATFAVIYLLFKERKRRNAIKNEIKQKQQKEENL
jgi:heme exporter protein D